MSGSPTFFSEGHTPVPNQPEEMILQKILGVLIDNGSSVTGPTKATQPQVDAGTPGDFYVAPSTLANWQLPTGFTKLGISNIQTNFEPVLTRTITVSALTGSDTRTGLSKYNSFVPFATITAAVAAWVSGDTVKVSPGTYAEKNIALAEGIRIYHELGANVTFSGALSANDAVYTDAGVALNNFDVSGFGALSIHDTGNAQDGAVLRLRSAGSRGRFQCLSAVAGTSGTKGNAFYIDGGAVVFINVLATISAQDNCVYTGTGAPLVIINVGQSVTSPNGGFFCNAGNIYIGQCPLNTANLCMYVSASGTAIYHQVGTLTPSTNGIGVHGACFGTIATIVGTSGVYGVDGPAAGTMQIVVGGISGISGADGRGITSRGGGVTYVTVLGSNTATIAILASAGTTTIYNGEHFGSNATAAAQITNTGNAQILTLVNSTVRNAHATATAIDIADTSAFLVLQGGCALVPQTGATYSVSGSASTNMKCYGHSVGRKPIQVANVTLLVGIFEDDTDVT